MKNQNKTSQNQIRKRTAIAHILAIIVLPFFIYFGYKNSNLVIEIACLIFFLLVFWNAYKYFFKTDYRKHLNEYHNQQDALPKEERDGYLFSQIQYGKIKIGIVVLIITILTGIILNFFNLL